MRRRTQERPPAARVRARVDEIVIDFLELDGIREGLAAARPKATVVAAPRIIKPAEEALWRVLLQLDPAPDAISCAAPAAVAAVGAGGGGGGGAPEDPRRLFAE